MHDTLRPRVRALLVALGLGCPVVGGALGAPAEAAPAFCVVDLSAGSTRCTTTASSALAMVSSGVTLARLFDAPNRSTADGYVDITAAGPCDALPGQDWELATMPPGWNDRVSSFQGYNGCEVKVWQNGGFAGSSYGPVASASTLGALDNATSSVTFY